MAKGDFYTTRGIHAAFGRTFNTPRTIGPGGGLSGLVAVISHTWQRRFASDSSVFGRIAPSLASPPVDFLQRVITR